MPKVYTDAEVDDLVADLIKKLPEGSSVNYSIYNAGQTVSLDVALPENVKRDTFEHGLLGGGGTFRGKTKKTRQGPEFGPAAVTAIVEWSKRMLPA